MSTPVKGTFTNALLSASELVLSYGDHRVLDGATLAVYDNDKIGIVGRNGCGKSTFLKITAGEEHADAGDVSQRNGIVTGYLSQDFTLRENATVVENVRDGAAHVVDLIERYEAAAADASDASGHLLDQIEACDGWSLDSRLEALMRELSAPDPERNVRELSGGEKRRVALCRALAGNPDLLILDEPTNHLDAESIDWLEAFLQQFRGACLFVTHDRYFLDRIATRVAELDGGRFYSHEGNYSDYLLAKSERQEAEMAKDNRRRRFLRLELEWVRAGVKARTTKARSRLDNYAAIAAETGPTEELDMELILPTPPALGNIVVNAEEISACVPGTQRWLFAGLNLAFEAGTCTGVIGRNGLGKTTLLRILLGGQEPLSGSVRIGKKTVFNYIDQHRIELDGSKSVLEEVAGKTDFVQFGAEKISVRAYLKRFLFTDDRIHMRIDVLSGGERNRVMLAKILRNGGNFLILDEPTNDLDLQTLRVLEEAILAFSGCVLVVSHDRYFLDRVCDRMIAFEGDGEVFVSEGNYSYYHEKNRERLKARNRSGSGRMTAPTKAQPQEKPAATAKSGRKLKWKEERELEQMEATILAREEEAAALEETLNSPEYYIENSEKAPELAAKLASMRDEIQGLYERWEELELIKSGSNLK
ncbi:MAG: ABC-F family ATP-binding cassette domain-containing protein [Verrucomicrobiae bacterium]|nr:ABC-F family ATP-binding cassette domain-containing protein [Verrucomicrobiae bacterium]